MTDDAVVHFMKTRCLIQLFLLLVAGVVSYAHPVAPALKKIDSLIHYNQLAAAQAQTDSLYHWVQQEQKSHQLTDVKLHLLLNKAYIHKLKDEIPQALKLAYVIIDEAQNNNLPGQEYRARLIAALSYEHSREFNLCKNHLDQAYLLYKQYHLDSIYSIYCIRTSSYYRFLKKTDSALYFAEQALEYALKYNNPAEKTDAYLLIGILLGKTDYRKAIPYTLLAAKDFSERNEHQSSYTMYANIAGLYIRNDEPHSASPYLDSLWNIQNTYPISNAATTYNSVMNRYFDKMGNKDSAYYFFVRYHEAYLDWMQQNRATEIKKITEQYENDKKEGIIKNKNITILLVVAISMVILSAAILLMRKNKKIRSQNKVITNQMVNLQEVLEQKQILLSELQHRVKNNMQHAISILELQKESADFNNIEELIRENQNRLQSMLLLNSKLNTIENIQSVNIEQYIVNLSHLVKDSYHTPGLSINLVTRCDMERMPLSKAQSIGLIIVELISNSIKHAFGTRPTGSIEINIARDPATGDSKLIYTDDGPGFDFKHVPEKGLGLEIIKGLIAQLNGSVSIESKPGFKLTICFT